MNVKPIIFNLEGENTKYKQQLIQLLNEKILEKKNCHIQSDNTLQKQLKDIKKTFEKNIDSMSKIFLCLAIQYEYVQKLSSDCFEKKIIFSSDVLSELLINENFDEWKDIWKTVLNSCKENLSNWKIFLLLENNNFVDQFKYLYKEIENNLFVLNVKNSIEENIKIVLEEIEKINP